MKVLLLLFVSAMTFGHSHFDSLQGHQEIFTTTNYNTGTWTPHLGDHFGNGASFSQSNFSYAYLNMEKALENLLEYEAVNLTVEERELTLKILATLNIEYARNPKIQPSKNGAYPFFRHSNCYNKIACTFSEVGSLIFINMTLIERLEDNPGVSYISFARASGIIAHELGHHHGYGYEHEQFLTDYGTKVWKSLGQMGDSHRIPNFNHPHVLSRYQNFPEIQQAYVGLVDTNEKGIELNIAETIEDKFKCKKSDEKYHGFTVNQFYWHPNKVNSGQFDLIIDVTQYCTKEAEFITYKFEQLRVLPRIRNKKLISFDSEYLSCNGRDKACLKQLNINPKEKNNLFPDK